MLTLTSDRVTIAHSWPAGTKLAVLVLWTFCLFALPWPAAAAELALVTGAAWALGLGAVWVAPFRRLWSLVLVLALWNILTGTPGLGAITLLRMFAAIGAANLVTMTTRLADMQAVFLTIARPLSPLLPAKVLALALALVIRFIPHMLIRWDIMTQALRARSLRKNHWHILMPAVLAALDDADHVAEALRARGGVG